MQPAQWARCYSCANVSALSDGSAFLSCAPGSPLCCSANIKHQLIRLDSPHSDPRKLRVLWLYLCGSSNLDGYPESFIVRVTHGHANMHGPTAELQHIVRPRIGRKPVVPLDIFAKCFKTWKNIFLAMLLNVRNRFA